GVLIDAHRQQARVSGKQNEKPTDSAALREMLIDYDVLKKTEAGDHIGHPLTRRFGPDTPRHHVRAHNGRAGTRARDDRSLCELITNTFHDQRASKEP